jgi:hypothetical protein
MTNLPTSRTDGREVHQSATPVRVLPLRMPACIRPASVGEGGHRQSGAFNTYADAEGLTFAFSRNRFVGSYRFLMVTSRA